MGHDTWVETTEEDREEWKQHLNMKNPKFAEDLLSNGGVNADIRTKLNVFNRYSIEWNFDFMETGGAEGYIDEIEISIGVSGLGDLLITKCNYFDYPGKDGKELKDSKSRLIDLIKSNLKYVTEYMGNPIYIK